MKELQEKLGYAFRDLSLLELALTAPAWRMDHPQAVDNQRLEFLGDAVFGLMSAEALYALFPEDGEGALTVRRTKLASGAALAAAAEKLGLRRLLRRNRGAEELPQRAKPLADAMEAVLGAVWLDGGVEAARDVFGRLWSADALRLPLDEWSANPKGHLQVLVQAMRPPRRPVYEVLETRGPAHNPEVFVKVTVRDVGEAVGSGHSRREAECAAAAALLPRFGDGA